MLTILMQYFNGNLEHFGNCKDLKQWYRVIDHTPAVSCFIEMKKIVIVMETIVQNISKYGFCLEHDDCIMTTIIVEQIVP